MATDPVSPFQENDVAQGCGPYPLSVLTNLPGTELRFNGRDGLITFATIASGRVATSLEVLLKQIDDHMLAVVLENIADLAFQVHGAINTLVATSGEGAYQGDPVGEPTADPVNEPAADPAGEHGAESA